VLVGKSIFWESIDPINDGKHGATRRIYRYGCGGRIVQEIVAYRGKLKTLMGTIALSTW
jgi:hypothetical protein